MKEEQQQTLAVFIDFENLALGLKDRKERFAIDRVMTRLLEKGNIVVKRAYADWSKFASYTASLHEAAIELIEIPIRRMTGKNSADMRLCVDAMDLSYSKHHINTFVILSGDSDFSPLVSKLRENNKQVILASGFPPDYIAGLEEAAGVQFTQGWIVDLKKPTPAQYKAILDQRARELGLSLPEARLGEFCSGSLSLRDAIKALENLGRGNQPPAP